MHCMQPRNTGNTSNIGVNWFNTFNFGKAIGGYLLTLTSNIETAFISSAFLNNTNLSLDGNNTIKSQSDGNIWLGFAKIVEPGNPVRLGWITGERSKVNWSTDPSATETNFSSGEPNNSNGVEGYVHIWSTLDFTARTWNDAAGNSTAVSNRIVAQVIVEFNN